MYFKDTPFLDSLGKFNHLCQFWDKKVKVWTKFYKILGDNPA